jgi:predicted permease
VYIRSRPASVVPDFAGISVPELQYLQTHTRTLSHLAIASRSGRSPMSDGGRVVGQVQRLYVSASYFDALQLPMIAGRGIAAAEDDYRAPATVAVIGRSLWRSGFDRDPEVVGRRVLIGTREYTVIGVADALGFMDYAGAQYPVALPLAALALDGSDAARAPFVDPRRELSLATKIGRLIPGASAGDAAAELTTLSRQFRDAAGLPPISVSAVDTRPLSRGGSSSAWQTAQLVFLALLLVQMLACANIGNMLLARGLARRREMAIRLSLGAGRRRLVRQLVTEAGVLSGLAAAIALIFPVCLPALLRRFGSEYRRETAELYSPDLLVFWCALAMAALTAIACGLAPALHTTRVNLAETAGARHGQDRGGVRLRRLLLATQVALATVLLTSAGLLTRAITHALSLDPGFALTELQAISIRLPSGTTLPAHTEFHRALDDTIRQSDLPPIALADEPPLSDSHYVITVRHSHEREGPVRAFRHQPVSSNYFDVTGVRLLQGRAPADAARREIVVSESVARQLWSAENPIGKVLLAGSRTVELTTLEVVGLAADVSVNTLGETEPVIYRGTSYVRPTLLVRDLSPAVVDRVRALATGLEPRAVVTSRPLRDNARESLAASVAGSRMAWAIGGLALLLAAMGAFGVFAYAVEERRREIGIRIALGARMSQVVRFVVGRTQGTVVAGLVVGLGLAAAAAPLLGRFLYGLSPFDARTYLQVAALLAASAALATWLPARRAARVDPVTTLRCD